MARDAPAQFFPYLKALYEVQGTASVEQLVDVARTVGGIPLDSLERCIRSECMRGQLAQNARAAQALMGADYGTPALYVDGVRLEPLNYSGLMGKLQ